MLGFKIIYKIHFILQQKLSIHRRPQNFLSGASSEKDPHLKKK